jgi:hypothetical protein
VILIALVFIDKIYAVLFVGPDLALFPALWHNLFPTMPQYTTSIPYSVFWSWINPLWLGRFWYGVYVVILDALTTIGYWKVKRIPKKYLAFWQVLSIFFYIGQGAEYQNVTVFVWLPLAFIRLQFLIIPILVKLPIGWSYPWDISNEHVQCIFKCNGFKGIPTNLPMIDYVSEVLVNIGVLYTILVFGWLWTYDCARRTKPSYLQYCPVCGKYWNKDSVHFNLGNCKVCHRPTRLCFFKRCYLCARMKRGF